MKELKAHLIQREIDEKYKKLHSHQEQCKHLKATKKYCSNTGNYDPSQDSYWIDFYCETCLKRWSEKQ